MVASKRGILRKRALVSSRTQYDVNWSCLFFSKHFADIATTATSSPVAIDVVGSSKPQCWATSRAALQDLGCYAGSGDEDDTFDASRKIVVGVGWGEILTGLI